MNKFLLKCVWRLAAKRMIYFIILVFLTCCNQSSKPPLVKVSHKSSISSVYDEINKFSLIQLKGNGKDFITYVNKVIEKDLHFYLKDLGNDGRIFKFDNKGNLLAVLSDAGKGPEEYYNLKDFCVNEKGEVFVADLAKILIYDKNFNLIRIIKTKERLKIGRIKLLSDSQILVQNGLMEGDLMFYVLNIDDGEVVERIKIPEEETEYPLPPIGSNSRQSDPVYVSPSSGSYFKMENGSTI